MLEVPPSRLKGGEKGRTAGGEVQIKPLTVEMILVPPGEFRMGTAGYKWRSEFPEHTVLLDAYMIDKTEVTIKQYKLFLDYMTATGNHSRCSEDELGFFPDGKDHTPEQWDIQLAWMKYDWPVTNIDWYDAYAFCAWCGKRLPTEAEWEKAARGEDGLLYPWGNRWNESKCNNVKNSGHKKKPVGSFPDGASPYGLLDMAGNVWEWCLDWFQSDYYSVSPGKDPRGPSSGEERVLRGGCFANESEKLRTVMRQSLSPGTRTNSVGFRCVSELGKE